MREDWAREAYRRLSAAGLRSGSAREDVIETLARDGGCVTVPQLVERMTRAGGRAAPASVYRALSTLRELGLVRAFDHGQGILRYELEDPADAHHHHLVCKRCGSTEPFVDGELVEAISTAARARGYGVVGHEVVLYGLCRACSPA